MKKLSCHASAEILPASDTVEVPREFLAFMAVLSREFISSDKVSLTLMSFKELLTRAYGEEYADEYVMKLAAAFSDYRKDPMQSFMG